MSHQKTEDLLRELVQRTAFLSHGQATTSMENLPEVDWLTSSSRKVDGGDDGQSSVALSSSGEARQQPHFFLIWDVRTFTPARMLRVDHLRFNIMSHISGFLLRYRYVCCCIIQSKH